MSDNFTFLDATSVSRTIRATEISSGIWVPWNVVRGVLAQGDAATSEPPVLLGAVRRANVSSLEGADGTVFQLIGDGDGRLRVTVEGTTSFVQPSSSGFEVQTAEQHGVVYTSAGVELTVKKFYAEVAGGSTNQSIVGVVTGKKIVVISLTESVGAAQTTVTWVSKPSGTGSTIDKRAWDAYGGRVLPKNPDGWLETVAGEALCLTTVGDITYVSGRYIEV